LYNPKPFWKIHTARALKLLELSSLLAQITGCVSLCNNMMIVTIHRWIWCPCHPKLCRRLHQSILIRQLSNGSSNLQPDLQKVNLYFLETQFFWREANLYKKLRFIFCTFTIKRSGKSRLARFINWICLHVLEWSVLSNLFNLVVS